MNLPYDEELHNKRVILFGTDSLGDWSSKTRPNASVNMSQLLTDFAGPQGLNIADIVIATVYPGGHHGNFNKKLIDFLERIRIGSMEHDDPRRNSRGFTVFQDSIHPPQDYNKENFEENCENALIMSMFYPTPGTDPMALTHHRALTQ